MKRETSTVVRGGSSNSKAKMAKRVAEGRKIRVGEQRALRNGIAGTAIVAAQTSKRKTRRAAEPTVDTAATAADVEVNEAAPKRERKPISPRTWKIIGSIIAAIAIIGGGAWWYCGYYNTDQTIVSSALNSLMSHTSNRVSYTFNIANAATTVSGKGDLGYLTDGSIAGDVTADVKAGSSSLSLPKINFASKSDDLYLKTNLTSDLKKTIDLGTADGKWIKTSTNEVNSMISNHTMANIDAQKAIRFGQCLAIAGDKLNSHDARQQVIKTLIDTQFVKITPGDSSNDGRKFSLTVNTDKYSDFIGKFTKTNYYKALNNCLASKGIDLDKTLAATDHSAIIQLLNDANPTVTITVKGLMRNVNKLSFEFRSQLLENRATDTNVTVKFGRQKPEIKIPADVKSVSQVLSENPTLQSLLSTNQTNNAIRQDVSKVAQSVKSYYNDNPYTPIDGSKVQVLYSNGQKGAGALAPYMTTTLSSNSRNVLLGPATADIRTLSPNSIWVLAQSECSISNGATVVIQSQNPRSVVIITRLSDNSYYCISAS